MRTYNNQYNKRKVNCAYDFISKSGREWKIVTYKDQGNYYMDISYRQNKPGFTFYGTKNRANKEDLFALVDLAQGYLKDSDIF